MPRRAMANGVRPISSRSLKRTLPPRGGSVRFKDRELIGLTPFAIARLGIGYAPEGRQLFAPLTVVQNLRIPFVNKHPDQRQWSAQLERVFALFPRLAER